MEKPIISQLAIVRYPAETKLSLLVDRLNDTMKYETWLLPAAALFLQFGVDWRCIACPHKLENVQRQAADDSDDDSLPHKLTFNQELAIYHRAYQHKQKSMLHCQFTRLTDHRPPSIVREGR